MSYLYLTEKDYQDLASSKSEELNCIECEKVVDVDSGKGVYRINAIIGREHGIGVENLRGSGLIAGGTARAYKDIFTLTLVTCRSVGIYSCLIYRDRSIPRATWSENSAGGIYTDYPHWSKCT